MQFRKKAVCSVLVLAWLRSVYFETDCLGRKIECHPDKLFKFEDIVVSI
jgi:hypothetical protein